MNKRNFILLFFVFIASITLIAVNFYTIKILSGIRSYINGESEYSKGQKDAVVFLSSFIQTQDVFYSRSFNESINTPKGDNLARTNLTNGGSDEIITRGFLMGKNHPDDIPDMIWLFKRFKSISFMKECIQIWKEADALITELDSIGSEVYFKTKNNELSPEYRRLAIIKISSISTELSKKESSFSHVMGNAARDVNEYLRLANILCIILIIGNISIYVTIMLNKLHKSKEILEAKNLELLNTNKELDTFVYSLSHDLRSPITSIKGLLNITKQETELPSINNYLDLIEGVIDKQDSFIKEIISFFKNKRTSVFYSQFSLVELIECVVSNNKYAPQAQNIIITRELLADDIYNDELRLKIILNNLISNAIKYSDERKSIRTIDIKTNLVDNNLTIVVEDNGIGIAKEYFTKIFNMFYVASSNNRGTGLGLYILKENVEVLNGTVEVESAINKGTRFTITLPCVQSRQHRKENKTAQNPELAV